MNKHIDIPLARPQLPDINKYKKLLDRIWETRMISNFGYYAKQMEKISSDYLNTKNLSVVSSGDIGLIIALLTLDLPKNSEVILSPFTFNSTANSVIWNGLSPVFADIDAETWCVDPEDVLKKITKRTKVILGTHVFGNPCEIEKLRKIVKGKEIFLVFDAAQAYGSKYKKMKVGTLGDIEVFSFSGTKTVVSGEGGLVVTAKKELSSQVKLIRNYGYSKDYNSQRLGINGKISEFNAALGCLSLRNVEKSVKIRNKIANYYHNYLNGVGDLVFQKIEKDNVSTYKDYCVLTSKREQLAEYLLGRRIETRNYFFPINKMFFYKKYYQALKNADLIAKRSICLPIYNEISKEQLDYVISCIKDFFAHVS